MIELQNEQLANCRGFDEETFNYPPVEKVPYCLKLICPFWLLPCPRCLSVSGYPLLLLTSPLPPWVSASPSSEDNHSPEWGLDTVLFVKCGPKIWALGEKDERTSAASHSGKGSSRSISFDFVLSWSLYSLRPQRPPLDWTGGSPSLSCPGSAPPVWFIE